MLCVTYQCSLLRHKTTAKMQYYDTIRYGRLTCAQKLTRWPA